MRYALGPMPYALCPIVPHVTEKGYIDVPYCEVFLNIHWCPQQQKNRYRYAIAMWDTTFPSNRIVRYGLS